MKILAVETSCDETAAAVVEDGTVILSSVIASSKDAFERSGGVIPEEAARRQVESINSVIDQALSEASLSMKDIDALAVTKGPGLLVSLLVGTTTIRTIASIHKKPLIGVHHTLGHLSSVWLEADPIPTFPIITLSVSGGHSDLWYRTSHTKGNLIGRTLDDAAGEAFDKGAHLLGLPYPGGPSISREAENGSQNAFEFPRPLLGKDTLNFSFSGLKTALKYLIRDLGDSNIPVSDIAASYQHAICRHLTDRIVKALEIYPDAKEVHLVGGVSANTHLRTLANDVSDVPVRTPIKITYCTDNAAMIGVAAFFLRQEQGEAIYEPFETAASLPLRETVH